MVDKALLYGTCKYKMATLEEKKQWKLVQMFFFFFPSEKSAFLLSACAH